MQFRIRNFAEFDIAAVIAIGHAIYPEYREDSWHAAEQVDLEGFNSFHYVAEAAGILGYGAVRYLRQGQGRIDLMVRPEWQRRGIGAKLLERLITDLLSTGSAAAHARVRQDYETALSFLRHRGFAERQRMYGLKLDLSRARLDLFRPIVSRLEAQGARISTFVQERATDPDCLAKLLDLHNAVLPSWPDPESLAFQPASFERFARRLERETGDRPDALFIAVKDNLYVGYSGMFALGTAVHPQYRGRGIATALKVHTIRYALQMQVAPPITCTANPIMLAINENLGYSRDLVEIRMMRRLA